MQVHNRTARDFLNSRVTMAVPVYQRNYSWGDDQCVRLFQDVAAAADPGSDPHFMGTVCVRKDGDVWSVIDGQQRLTSLSLLLGAVSEICGDRALMDEIRDTCLFNKSYEAGGIFVPKMRLNKQDATVYASLLEGGDDLPEGSAGLKVYGNYSLFLKLAREYMDSGRPVRGILSAMSKLNIVELEIEGENPQDIFECLNSTGLGLSDVDLLRNYLLMSLPDGEQERFYDEYWSAVETYVGTHNMASFLTDYLIFRRMDNEMRGIGRNILITKGNLLSCFRAYCSLLPGRCRGGADAEHLFKDLRYCASLYRNFVFDLDEDLGQASYFKRCLYLLVSEDGCGCTQCRSLLLFLCDLHAQKKIDGHQLFAAVRGVQSLVFRSKVRGRNGMGAQFCGSVMRRLVDIDDYTQFEACFWKAITSGHGSFSFPSDADFSNALLSVPVYNTLRVKGVRYFLYMLDAHEKPKDALPWVSVLGVDHVMPTRPGPGWGAGMSKDAQSRHASLVHTMGNLVLVGSGRRLSAKSFSDKAGEYRESMFVSTHDVGTCQSWSFDDITARGRQLVNAALQVWPLPAAYQTKRAAVGQVYALGADGASMFTSTRPFMLVFDSEEICVSTWKDFLTQLCRCLDLLDHNAFVKAVQQSGGLQACVDPGDGSCASDARLRKVADGVYVRSTLSAASILGLCWRLVSAFDGICGTDYSKGGVVFQIRK